MFSHLSVYQERNLIKLSLFNEDSLSSWPRSGNPWFKKNLITSIEAFKRVLESYQIVYQMQHEWTVFVALDHHIFSLLYYERYSVHQHVRQASFFMPIVKSCFWKYFISTLMNIIPFNMLHMHSHYTLTSYTLDTNQGWNDALLYQYMIEGIL